MIFLRGHQIVIASDRRERGNPGKIIKNSDLQNFLLDCFALITT
ncbi:MAG: hypothetical protein ACEY3D_09980 [Rickettsia sp.]